MNLLASIPVWVYTAILIITFIGAHVLAFRPNEPGGKGIVRGAMRVGSAALLVVGIVLIQPHEPGSVLLAIGAAALGGFVSGRAAPPLPRPGEPNVAEDEQTLEDPAS